MSRSLLPRTCTLLAAAACALGALPACRTVPAVAPTVVPPTITTRAIVPRNELCRSIVVLSLPALYVSKDPKTSAGTQLEGFAQGLLTQVSTRLNEAGNDTSTTYLSRPGTDLSKEILLRHTASGVSHALVVSPKRGAFAGGLLREIEVEAVLLDAKTLARQWEFQYQDLHASGNALPKVAQALIDALRESRCVK